ncbi:MAG: DUF1887 family CARF protein [Mariprofundaceae bacterium]|nr:DUF1887 family CARF protein [Mariprofundaceae bacterium]
MQRPDILIQNVSGQCIPNLVAAKTFRPRKIIWVYTPEFGNVLNCMREAVSGFVPEQENWRVDARDVEGMHRALSDDFAGLPAGQHVCYHLTGGTKSMSLQGLYNLGTFRRSRAADVRGIVMNPRTQHFDVIYPHPVNSAVACTPLALEEMLAVHGNRWDGRHAHVELEACIRHYDLWEAMRGQAVELKRVWSGNDMRALHRQPVKGSLRRFRSLRPLPALFRRSMSLLEENGWLSGLSFPAADQVCYEQHSRDIIKLISGGWLEYWLGAVLYESGIEWMGARISAKILERGGGSQEFDFLGARQNHLVYWSCKTDKKLTNDKLFEVDALRDGIAGSDFHVAGVLHVARIQPVMQAKARRMHLHLVNAFASDAAEQVVRVSGS